MRGYYLMHRGWLDHPALGGNAEPYCRRAAWAWLIEHAAYQEHEVTVAGKQVSIARGQLSTSLRTLAQQWGWTDPKVRRFLRNLSEESMIKCVADAAHTLITICNYVHFQGDKCVGDAPCDKIPGDIRPDAPNDALRDAPRDAPPDEITNSKETEISAAADPADAPRDALPDAPNDALLKQRFKQAGKEGESPPPIVPPPPSGAKNGRRKPKREFPADWLPDERDVAFALSQGRTRDWIEREGPRCRDFHLGKGNLFADIPAAWRTWVHNADDFAPRDYRPNGSAGRPTTKPGEITSAIHSIINRRNVGGQ